MEKESHSAANRRIAKNTLILYVRMLFMMAVSLYTSRVVLTGMGGPISGSAVTHKFGLRTYKVRATATGGYIISNN